MQQVTPVRKASKDSDSTYLKYSEQFDMYYKSASKKAQMINDGAISSYNYTSSGLEAEERDGIPHFDKQA